MKDHLAQLVRAHPTPAHGRNVTREYLQARILGALQRADAMIPLAFHGGTALRFLYASSRYSEDLDFALEKDKDRYDFRVYLQALKSELALEGYTIELSGVISLYNFNITTALRCSRAKRMLSYSARILKDATFMICYGISATPTGLRLI